MTLPPVAGERDVSLNFKFTKIYPFFDGGIVVDYS
jgi:hypothetical protein